MFTRGYPFKIPGCEKTQDYQQQRTFKILHSSRCLARLLLSIFGEPPKNRENSHPRLDASCQMSDLFCFSWDRNGTADGPQNERSSLSENCWSQKSSAMNSWRWWYTYLPLWKMMEWKSGIMTFFNWMESHKIPWFQTTNQNMMYIIVYHFLMGWFSIPNMESHNPFMFQSAPSSEPTPSSGLLSIQKITFQLFVVHVAQGLSWTTWGQLMADRQLQRSTKWEPCCRTRKVGGHIIPILILITILFNYKWMGLLNQT